MTTKGKKIAVQSLESFEKEIHERIEMLRDKEAVFVLRALILAGHVSLNTMRAAMDLAGTVRHDN